MTTRLLVTGADGTGKTEYCKRTASRLRIAYRHFGVPTEANAYDEYVAPLAKDMEGWPKPDGFIYDRGFVDEMVWPAILGRETLNGFDADNLLNVYSNAGVELIIVYRNPVEIVTELKDRGETNPTITYALKGQDAFINLALSGSLWPLPWSIVESDLLRWRDVA